MKKIIKYLTLAFLAGSFAFGLAQNKRSEVRIDAATQTDRRIYVYLEGAWDGTDMYIHYWGGTSPGTTWASCPIMTRVLSDYWQGMYYYDIPADVTEFLVKNATGNVTKASNQSVNILVSNLMVEENHKIVAVKGWTADSSNRLVGFSDTAPGNSGQIAAILNHINSCSDSFASGYNAWPQINDLFIESSALDLNTVVIDNFGPDTTIGNKITYLEMQYTTDGSGNTTGGGGGGLRVTPSEDNSMIATVTIGLIGLSSLLGYHFINKKRIPQ
ncbi:MAG: hypothetical protein WC968_01170 [Bacilli bacterium]